MSESISEIPGWVQTRRVLFDCRRFLNGLQLETASNDTAWAKIFVEQERLSDLIRRHAEYSLHKLDEAAAGSGLIDRVKAASEKARKEADRIKNITKKIDDVVGVLDKVTEVVGLFGQIAAL